MNPILKNVLVFIAAAAIGGFINAKIIEYSGSIVPLPEGVDPENVDSIRENIHRYSVPNLLMPFLAHALGTLVGAFLVAKFAVSHQLKLALGIGALFIIGGIIMIYLIPETPIWLIILDLVGAYFLMGWLGWKLAGSPISE